MSKRKSLLRVSDFCRHDDHDDDNDHDDEDGSDDADDDETVRFRQAGPACCCALDTTQYKDGSLAWATLAFFRKHKLVNGRLVKITFDHVAVVVRIFAKMSNPHQEKQVTNDDENDDDDDDDDDLVELSSLAYTNLMGRSPNVSKITTNFAQTNDRIRYGKISVLRQQKQQGNHYLPIAPKVTLRQWRRRQIPQRDDNSPTLPPPWPQDGSILTIGGWVVATTAETAGDDDDHHHHHHDDDDKTLYFYEVLEVCNERDETMISTAKQEQTFFLSKKGSTLFRLEQGPLDYTSCPVMPNVVLMQRLLRPVNDKSSSSSAAAVVPHPNCHELSQAWMPQPNRVVKPAECIWNIVGDPQEYNLQQAIESAAAPFRQVVVVQGLALFAYQAGRPLVAGGGLADKLTGLEHALQAARAAAPSILVLTDLDRELCPIGMGQDARLRHDQESRFLAVLLQELNMERKGIHNHSQLASVPSVLVVLATRRPLSAGPLRQHLVWDSIALRLPDASYTCHLWRQTMREQPTEQMLQLLQGRTAQEIEILARNVQMARKESDQAVEQLLQDACEKEDRECRMYKASTHVPSVHWSDIGGLAHVRREIMDAIELPLAHPHLFPKGAGRSGILLFGPPGTGKTLVAKAVATECKLPFLSVKGPELLGSYVGESEANVRNIFQDARERGSRNKPPACVLFFDEMESLAPKRGEQASGGGNVMDRVVATLFAEMDRNSVECQTFCIGATNRPDLLDSAMLRPGRFDRLVYLGIQKSDYTKILTAQLQHVKVDGDLQLIANAVADILPPSMTGADLSGIVSAALLRATHRLCEKADRELQQLQNEGKDVSIDMVLRNWTDEEAEPRVALYDLISAANDATPSLTEAELARYENLKHVMNVS